MMFWVVAYDRPKQTLLVKASYGDAEGATARRFALERQYASYPGVEVVTLAARSEADLRVTHSRYFRTSRQMAESVLTEVHHGRPVKRAGFLKEALRYGSAKAA